VFGTGWTLAVALTLQAAGTAPPQESKAPAPLIAWTDDRPLTHLFPNLFKDIRALPSSDTGVWLAVTAATALAARGSDERLADWSARSGGAAYTSAGRAFGSGWIQSGGAVAAYVAGRIAGKPQVAHVGSDLIRAQALNGLLTTAIKVSVGRTRPTGSHYAFPSGHASATFASAAVLHAHYGWKAGAPALAAATFVGWTRVRDGQHWLTDVAFGAGIGIISGRTVARTHTGKRVTMVPTKTKGGFSLTFFIN